MSTDAESLKAIALIVTAIGTPLSLIGVAMVGYMTKRQGDVQQEQGDTIKQVEKQGNSVSLELKRTNMVYARRLAVATSDPGDVAIADDAEKLYNAAMESAK